MPWVCVMHRISTWELEFQTYPPKLRSNDKLQICPCLCINRHLCDRRILMNITSRWTALIIDARILTDLLGQSMHSSQTQWSKIRIIYLQKRNTLNHLWTFWTAPVILTCTKYVVWRSSLSRRMCCPSARVQTIYHSLWTDENRWCDWDYVKKIRELYPNQKKDWISRFADRVWINLNPKGMSLRTAYLGWFLGISSFSFPILLKAEFSVE